MKLLIISILMTSFIACANSQEQDDEFVDFYRNYKNTDGVIAFNLPTFLVKAIVDDSDEELEKFVKKTDDIRFFISEKNNNSLYRKLNSHLPQSTYHDLMVIKDGSSTVTFKIREHKNKIQEILMMANGDSSFVAISFTGDFTIDDAKRLAKSIKTDEVGEIRL